MGRVTGRLARRHRWEVLAGVLVAVVGAAVLLVAVLALRTPRQVSVQAGSDTQVLTPSRVRPSASSSSSSLSSSSSASASSSASSSGSASSSAPKAPRSAGGARGAGVGAQPLVVLNDTTIPDLARAAASRFKGAGWHVSSYQESYTNDIVSTCAYYDPGVSGSMAAAIALQKQFPTIKRVVARFPELPAGPVVVVLTLDYSPS